MTNLALDVNDLEADALVVTQVLDAASRKPRAVRSASTDSPHAFAHIATGSYLVLSGRPELAVPDLATTSCRLDSHLEFEDRAPLDIAFTLPASTTLPFRPAAVTVELPPATLSGTITAAAYPYPGIQDAEITLHASAGSPGDLIGLRVPVALPHPPGAAVRTCTLGAGGAATTLTNPVDQGADVVVLQSTAGCVAGGVLVIGDAPSAEHARISAVNGGLNRVSLEAPLRSSRRIGDPARSYTITGTGPPVNLARAAEPGDGVLEISAAVPGPVIEIGGPVPEFRSAGAISAANGRWRLAGVRAIGRLTLTVAAAGYVTAGPLIHDVDYRHSNPIDLRLTV
jgi:hypothetical protein